MENHKLCHILRISFLPKLFSPAVIEWWGGGVKKSAATNVSVSELYFQSAVYYFVRGGVRVYNNGLR